MPPVVLKNGVKTAELEPQHLVALVNRKVDYRTSLEEQAALFEVLYASGVHTDWMADARHFSWNPIGGTRPTLVFSESHGLPRV